MIWTEKELQILLKNNNIQITTPAIGASIDTRTIQKHNIFFSLQGKFFNGNQFVSVAIRKGATLCIVKDTFYTYSSYKIIKVKDVEKVLNNFAVFRRQSIRGKIVAITGSVGKTSSKEFCKNIFSFIGKTFVNFSNFNNYYGLVISLINCPNV